MSERKELFGLNLFLVFHLITASYSLENTSEPELLMDYYMLTVLFSLEKAFYFLAFDKIDMFFGYQKT